MSNEDRHRILAALRLRDELAGTPDEDMRLRSHLSAVGRSAAQDHLQILAAEADHVGDTSAQAKIERARKILASGVPLEVGELAINGGQVMKLTGAKGPLIGEILRGLLAKVLEDPSVNSHEKLAELAIGLSDATPE
jgi:tRNA nucleotidyltransferase (CCA-adding enzyme)